MWLQVDGGRKGRCGTTWGGGEFFQVYMGFGSSGDGILQEDGNMQLVYVMLNVATYTDTFSTWSRIF